eukprot:13548930-Alexandrium_andersonii.AAC.1
MDHAPHVSLRMVKAACAGLTSKEAEALQRLGEEGLPPGGCRARPVQAPDELRALPRLCHLRGQGHVHILVDERVQVGLPDIDEQSLTQSRTSPACAGTPARGQV